MPYVQRNEENKIVGVTARKQDYATEFLPDDHEEVQAYLNPVEYKTRFTAREFLRKLTSAEKVAMKTHSDMGVQLWYDELIAADFVDVEDPDTIAAAEYGVEKEVFSEARKDELLQPEEIEQDTDAQ